MELDETSQAILRVLREDARLSYREVAQRVGVSPPTVSRKVRDLEELGLLRGYQAVVDPHRAGEEVSLLEVHGTLADLREAAERLGDLPAVREVLLLTGSQLLVRLHHREARELDRALERLEAVAGVREVVHHRVREVLTAAPSSAPELPAEARGGEADVACHQCGGPIHGPPVRTREGDRLHVFCCTTCRDRFRERVDRVKESEGEG